MYAELQGASFYGAQLQGAWLWSEAARGVARWSAAARGVARSRSCKGRRSIDAQLQGASLVERSLQGASLFAAQLQGASLDQGATSRGVARLCEMSGSTRELQTLTSPLFENLDCTKRPWEDVTRIPQSPETYQGWRDKILSNIPEGDRKYEADESCRLLIRIRNSRVLIRNDVLERNTVPSPARPRREAVSRVPRYAGLFSRGCAACCPWANTQWADRGDRRGDCDRCGSVAQRKGRPETCPGVKGFTEEDWAQLDELVARVQKEAAKTSAPSQRGAPPDGP